MQHHATELGQYYWGVGSRFFFALSVGFKQMFQSEKKCIDTNVQSDPKNGEKLGQFSNPFLPILQLHLFRTDHVTMAVKFLF